MDEGVSGPADQTSPNLVDPKLEKRYRLRKTIEDFEEKKRLKYLLDIDEYFDEDDDEE
mgnify:CR=1 FL=1|tara:strand:- start:75 stop:248 length:174 start_codon:yes stop_codon:yes gene_type:complete